MSLKQGKTQAVAPRFGRLDADMAEVDSAIVNSREFLLSQQHPEGYWCGELEADSMLEADYIFLHTLLESGDPRTPAARLHREDAIPELRRQLEPLSRWPWEHLALSKMLFLRKVDGYRRGGPAPCKVPHVGARARWSDCVQHLHQDVPLCVGAI